MKRMGKSAATAGIALVAIAGLSGCGGKPDGCRPLGGEVAQAIEGGATGDLTLHEASGQAIEAASGVYYVAYKVTAAGADGTAVWALNEVNPPGAIRSVDGFAQQFTRWPTLPGANGSDTASEALACLG